MVLKRFIAVGSLGDAFQAAAGGAIVASSLSFQRGGALLGVGIALVFELVVHH
jgi:hypothetical protein